MIIGRKKKEISEDSYYRMFTDLCVKIFAVSEHYADMIRIDEGRDDKVSYMKVLETECDMEVHKIYQALREGKLPYPIDKDDIYSIAKELDDIVDSMEEMASRVKVFGIKTMRPEALGMADLTVEAVKELKNLFNKLPETDCNEELKEIIIEINRIENDGDVLYRRALASLFRNEENPVEIIKWMRLFDEMEDSLDACERVANLIQSVIMKRS